LKELIIRTITGIFLIILLPGSLLLGPGILLPVLLLVYFQGLRELAGALNGRPPLLIAVHTLAGGMILLLTLLGLQYQVSPLWMVIPVFIWTVAYLISDKHFGLLAMFWLAVPLAIFLALGWMGRKISYDPLLPLAVITLVWINDTFAYVVGRLIGRNRMAPVLSPGKTWEGFFGGILFTLLGGWTIFRLTGSYSAAEWLIIAGAVGLSGFLGDLFESRLKRTRGIKNMGTLLPGHGGVLDRFDSLLFAAPVVLLLVIIINHYR
jgi:phosphatidate cytidylyltransferase